MKLTRLAVILCLGALVNTQAQNISGDETFGGTGNDSVVLRADSAADGGVFVASNSDSSPSGNKTAPQFGQNDAWIFKTAPDLTLEWQTTFGGSDRDTPQGIIATRDGGALAFGSSRSGVSGNKTTPNFGSLDAFAVKLSGTGQIEWQNSFGGAGEDTFIAALELSDGSFLLGGQSASALGSGNKTSAKIGVSDAWLVQLDSQGVKVWEQTYGGDRVEGVLRIHATSDGGFVIAGDSTSPPSGTKTSPSYSVGNFDWWIFKIDGVGNQLWDKTFGGNRADSLVHSLQTPRGDFVFVGRSESPTSGNKTAPHYGDWDFWAISTDANGNRLWERSFGGNGFDRLGAIQPTADCSGYVLGGVSNSGVSGSKTIPSFGDRDYWLIYTDLEGLPLFEEAYGGTGLDHLRDMVRNADRGLTLVGHSNSPPSGNKTAAARGNLDVWLVQLAPPRSVLELEAQLADTQAELADCEAENQLLEQQVLQLQAQLAGCEADKQALIQQNTQLVAENQQLSMQLAEVDSVVTNLEETLPGDIPGETLEEKVSALSEGISGLSPGQRKKLFK